MIPPALMELAESREGSPWAEFLQEVQEGVEPEVAIRNLLDNLDVWADWRLVMRIVDVDWHGPVPARFVHKGKPRPPLEVDWDDIRRQIWVADLFGRMK